MKFHWPAVLSWITTLAGVAGSPAVLGVLSPKVAAGVIIGGSVIQAFTKPVPKTDPAP